MTTKQTAQAMALRQGMGGPDQFNQGPPSLFAQLPSHLVAEALAAKNGAGAGMRWSGPITPDEVNYVEDYVQTRYPQIHTERLVGLAEDLAEGDEEDEEGEDHRRGGAGVGGGGEDFSLSLKRKMEAEARQKEAARLQAAQDSSKPKTGGGSWWSFSTRWLPSGSIQAQEPGKAKLNPGRLQEIMAQNQQVTDAHMSISELHTRKRVLQRCGVDQAEYHIVFCASSKEAFLLVGEAYPFHRHNVYLTCLAESLDSIRQMVAYKEAKTLPCPTAWLDLSKPGSQLSTNFRRKSKANPKGLFAFPLEAEDGGGARASLHWITEAQRNQWHVLLDASASVLDGAAGGGSAAFDLGPHKPDYLVCVSPKIVGAASRVTCLLVRRDSQLI
eukprot:jgi/Mesen1/8475/ME000478S07960